MLFAPASKCQIIAVRLYTKYRSLKPRRNWHNILYVLMSILGLSALSWVFWKTARPAPSAPTPSSSTPAVAPSAPVRTNLAVLAPPHPTLRESNVDAGRPPVTMPPVTVPPVTVPEVTVPAATNEDIAGLPFEPRAARDLFEAQIALAREGISPGSIDGRPGAQTRSALLAFQEKKGLPKSGILDTNTQAELRLMSPPLTRHVVTEEDLEGLRAVPPTWLKKSQLSRLGYENILEQVAEKSQAHPELIRRLNPTINWSSVRAGTVILIPEVSYPPAKKKAASVKIQLGNRTLEVYDDATNLLAHFPCSIARRVDKRPLGALHVASLVMSPNYVFDPEVFPESEEGRLLGHKLILPPGPNGPVGEVWIGLDKPGYGIHGTPRPEEVGRTESHGCFRLANWNADYLAQLVRVGTPVIVSP
jgi:lipoprotein-anchoring transpeptidase ErfK/SrfK